MLGTGFNLDATRRSILLIGLKTETRDHICPGTSRKQTARTERCNHKPSSQNFTYSPTQHTGTSLSLEPDTIVDPLTGLLEVKHIGKPSALRSRYGMDRSRKPIGKQPINLGVRAQMIQP